MSSQTKVETKKIFIRFKAILGKHFNLSINTLYYDNGGEFIALATDGISHLTTPPHTPELNGFSEQCHLHIVETCLTLLSYASLPLLHWSLAFATIL